ncbi:hypothetical protein [Peijinzhouia sedimentorum]
MASIRRTWLYRADSAFKREPLSFHWTPRKEIEQIFREQEFLRKLSEEKHLKDTLTFLKTDFTESAFCRMTLTRLKRYYDRHSLNKRQIEDIKSIYIAAKELGADGVKLEFINSVLEVYYQIKVYLPDDVKDRVETCYQYWVDFSIDIKKYYPSNLRLLKN